MTLSCCYVMEMRQTDPNLLCVCGHTRAPHDQVTMTREGPRQGCAGVIQSHGAEPPRRCYCPRFRVSRAKRPRGRNPGPSPAAEIVQDDNGWFWVLGGKIKKGPFATIQEARVALANLQASWCARCGLRPGRPGGLCRPCAQSFGPWTEGELIEENPPTKKGDRFDWIGKILEVVRIRRDGKVVMAPPFIDAFGRLSFGAGREFHPRDLATMRPVQINDDMLPRELEA